MRFEWDERKNKVNKRKHGIPFEMATEVFHDEHCFAIKDRVVDGEQRLWTIGRIGNFWIVVVVHTSELEDDEEVVRIISARKATPRERWAYEEADEQGTRESL